MGMDLRPSLALGAALIAAAIAPAAASADSVLVADPSASNVTVYGSTAAWSRKADDGTYRLVIRDRGQVADAPVPPSSRPYDPDLGPTSSNARVVVYARDGDLYRYTVGSGAELRIAALSSKAAESAPSLFKDAITFARATGWYLARPGRALTRLSKDVPRETDLAATRAAARFGTAARSFLRQSNYSGRDIRTIARAKTGEKVSSPTLTRFNVYWLRDLAGTTESQAEYVGVNAHRGLTPRVADRRFAFATSLATTNVPALYSSSQGVMTVEPKLRFR
jgi:hypothetical protein